MIVRRAFYREVGRTTAALIAVLVAVLLLYGITALLGRAARGDVSEMFVFALLGWQTAKRLDLLLPLAFYLGVLLTLGRWYRDHEMTVLAASGFGLPQLLRSVLAIAGVVAVITAVLAFGLTPYANRMLAEIKTRAAVRPELTGIAPGVFTGIGGDGGVIYAADNATGFLKQVFVNDRNAGLERIVTAAEADAIFEPSTGARWVVLHNGHAYQGVSGRADWRQLSFEHYRVRLAQSPLITPVATLEGMDTSALRARADQAALGEWNWRLAKPLLAFVLAFYAVVLAHTDARRGRVANLFGAVFVYFIYSNLLTVGQALYKKGTLPTELGLWWVHLVFAAIAAWLLWRRARDRPLWPLWKPGVAR